MPSHFCTYLDSCSVKNNFPSITYHIPSKPFLILPTIHFSHNPIPTRIRSSRRRRRRRSRTSLQLRVLPPDFDIVETSEHHDGSVIFRFGDPSEILKSHESMKDSENEVEEGSAAVKVLDGEHERDVTVNGSASSIPTDVSNSIDNVGIDIPVAERESDVDKDVSDSLLESSERLLEAPPEGEVSLPVSVSVVERETNVVADISDFEVESSGRLLEVSGEGKLSISEDEGESEVEIELSDSEEVLSEELPEISQYGELPLPVPVSVSEIELNDHVDIGLCLENDSDDEEYLNEKYEDASSSPDTVTVSDDSLRMKSTDDSHEVIAEVTLTMYVSPSIKLDLTIEETRIDVMLLSDQKTEAGLQTEVADSINDADTGISVVEEENDEVGDSRDPQLDLNERPLKISQEVDVDVSVPKIKSIDHFDMVSSLEEVVEGKDSSNEKDEDGSSMPDAVTDSSLSVENSTDTEQVTADDSGDVTEVQLPSADLDDLVLQEPSIEAMVSMDTMDQKGVAEPQLVDTKDSSENDTLEVTHISYPLEAEMMLDKGVSHDAAEESVEADEIESSTMLNHDVGNSLVEAKRTEEEEQSSELSEVSSVEAIQLELTETSVEWEEISTAAFFLSSGAAVLAHPSKALTGGEDSYFLSCRNWLGVADGVSQWSLEGIAPGVYAHELMKNCQNIVSDGGNAPMVNPIEVLSRSVKETNFSGSSTVLVAYFDGSAFHVANIGDTGIIIIRHGAVYKKSSPMLHEFNFPIHVESGDNPSQLAEEYRIDLDEGDTIITATDGLFDNLYEQEILAIVSKSLQTDMKPEEIAEVLAKRALEAGGSATSRSPFADAAQAAGYIGYTGGKLDDVAVIVSFVENRS